MLKTVSSIVNALGALNYKGTWNADTNTPTLASGVGNQGDYYVVSVAGTTDLDGTTNWGIGDWAVFNGSIWERLEGGADGNFVNLSVSNEATFPDNAKAIFGTGRDLEIYHDGSNSYITDAAGVGVGNLILRGSANVQIEGANGENCAIFNENSSVRLFYDNAEKLATTTSGILITGTASMGDINVAGSTPSILLTDTTGPYTHTIQAVNQELRIEANDDLRVETNNTQRMRIDGATGDISFYNTAGTSQALYWDALAESLTLSGTGGLTVEAASNALIRISDSTNTNQRLDLKHNGGVSSLISGNNGAYGTIKLQAYNGTDTVDRMAINAIGSVGIGESNPSNKLHVTQNVDGVLAIEVENQNTGASSAAALYLNGEGNNFYLKNYGDGTSNANITEFVSTAAGSQFVFATASQEAMRISSGNLMVGVTSTTLTGGSLTLPNSGIIAFHDAGGAARNVLQFVSGDIKHGAAGFGVTTQSFYTSNTLAATIDSSQNVLVGKTSASSATVGFQAGQDGFVAATRASAQPLVLNRTTSDGTILDLRKDGTTVGLIGTVGGDMYLGTTAGTTDNYIRFAYDTSHIIPASSAGAENDAVISLGHVNSRFVDIYATNGTIQTSDRNEKQDIEALSDAEQRVAVAAKGLLRKFRWKSAVEAKGDEARTHFGIIAQDLQAAFAAEGLDAGDYGMFINSTWTDEETGEERSRMGVRYSELLAFIISAI